ncbi:hypothetical protein [Holospora undulata]|uniref:hypothetical protein n=1 Tax=Holospora undulata TaxID=1169117 RepID=UPI001268352E|nr:hypothetical protein [Holospora undulata]
MVCKILPPLANTRSLEMLEGTLLIFAALHVNKTFITCIYDLANLLNRIMEWAIILMFSSVAMAIS